MRVSEMTALQALFLIGTVILVAYVPKLAKYGLCETVSPQFVVGPSGDRIEMDTEFCGPLAGDPGTITVRYRPTKFAATQVVFAYTPSSDYSQTVAPWYPTVNWDASGRVLIAIRVIDYIQTQSFAVGEKSFVYQIGRVKYP